MRVGEAGACEAGLAKRVLADRGWEGSTFYSRNGESSVVVDLNFDAVGR